MNYQQNWYRDNREYRREYSRRYYANHSDYREKIKLKSKQRYHTDQFTRERYSNWSRWNRTFGMDWVFLQLGNKCFFCDRTNQQVKLQIDHKIAQLTGIFGKGKHKRGIGGIRLYYQYIRGEVELRLLCSKCHAVSHALRI